MLFGLFIVLWGVSTYYVSMRRVLTVELGLCIRGTASIMYKGPPGWKCRSVPAVGQVQACLHTIHARSSSDPDFLAYSHIMFVFCKTCTDELHNVQLRVPLWELKQSPTWEIIVTNSDRPDLFLPPWLALHHLSFFILSIPPSPLRFPKFNSKTLY